MGKLTTHVLDTAAGKPGNAIAVKLFHCGAERALIVSTETNSDGRCDEPLLADNTFEPGTYELEFDIGAYFAPQLAANDGPPFLDIVTLRFTIAADQHYHVPLLVSPWSYSTYRGS
ncbi:MAG: hydroxyisourate hydrolase [Woeseiaceae bacterium]